MGIFILGDLITYWQAKDNVLAQLRAEIEEPASQVFTYKRSVDEVHNNRRTKMALRRFNAMDFLMNREYNSMLADLLTIYPNQYSGKLGRIVHVSTGIEFKLVINEDNRKYGWMVVDDKTNPKLVFLTTPKQLHQCVITTNYKLQRLKDHEVH